MSAKMFKEILVFALLASIMIPIALTTILNTNTSGWDASSVLIWTTVPVIILVVVLLKLFDKI